MMGKSVAAFAGEVITAVTVAVVGDTTVAFLGAKGGEIRKVEHISPR